MLQGAPCWEVFLHPAQRMYHITGVAHTERWLTHCWHIRETQRFCKLILHWSTNHKRRGVPGSDALGTSKSFRFTHGPKNTYSYISPLFHMRLASLRASFRVDKDLIKSWVSIYRLAYSACIKSSVGRPSAGVYTDSKTESGKEGKDQVPGFSIITRKPLKIQINFTDSLITS